MRMVCRLGEVSASGLGQLTRRPGRAVRPEPIGLPLPRIRAPGGPALDQKVGPP